MLSFIKKHLRFISLGALALYIITIFVLASISFSSSSSSNLLSNDKLLHIIEFFILTILVLITLEIWKLRDKRLLALILLLFMTLTSELLQLFILNRSFSALDMVADLTGGLLAFIVFLGGRLVWKFFKH